MPVGCFVETHSGNRAPLARLGNRASGGLNPTGYSCRSFHTASRKARASISL